MRNLGASPKQVDPSYVIDFIDVVSGALYVTLTTAIFPN